jgi:phosphatidylinositol phospholipase C delta
LIPPSFGGLGSLNWQVYDREMQINEAMFVGSPGWMSKPTFVRKSAEGNIVSLKKSGKEKLRMEIVRENSRLFQLSMLLLEIR